MKFIVPIIVGAIIGYITNWLAIKMLFRPYEKKYIFGLPLPFTPGLIPKEQKRIARSVGETVGDYLLSEDIIMENIERADLDKKLEDLLREEYRRLEEGDLSLKELLDSLDVGPLDNLERKISKELLNRILAWLGEEERKEDLEKVLDQFILNLDYGGEVARLKAGFISYLEDSKTFDQLEHLIRESLLEGRSRLEKEDRTLRDLIEEDRVEDFILKNSDFLIGIIKDAIDDFAIADRVKELLTSIIDRNMTRALKMFLSSDVIAEKIYRMLEAFIYSEDFKERLDPILLSGAGKLLDYRLGDLIQGFDPGLSQDLIDRLGKAFLEGLIYKNKEFWGDRVESLLISKEEDCLSRIRETGKRAYEEILERPEFRLGLERLIDRGLDKMKNIRLASILARLDEDLRIGLFSGLSRGSLDLLKRKLPSLLEDFNISQIVEEEINKFEVDFAEEIILDIASKELKAITWLGALLGAVMGIISPLLQMI